ncbi:MAG: hypothetical protein AAF485_11225 [Chloroflexota bacterium]
MQTVDQQTKRQKLQALLEDKKREIQLEIANYPPPIPACDQQFNYLLEQQATVAQALRRVNQDTTTSTSTPSIEEIIATLDFLDDAAIKDLASV